MANKCQALRNSRMTKCTCMHSLEAADIRSAATYAATTWYRKYSAEKVAEIAEWNQSKSILTPRCPFKLPGASETKMICQNALCAVLGISIEMWKKGTEASSSTTEIPAQTSTAVVSDLADAQGESIKHAILVGPTIKPA